MIWRRASAAGSLISYSGAQCLQRCPLLGSDCARISSWTVYGPAYCTNRPRSTGETSAADVRVSPLVAAWVVFEQPECHHLRTLVPVRRRGVPPPSDRTTLRKTQSAVCIHNGGIEPGVILLELSSNSFQATWGHWRSHTVPANYCLQRSGVFSDPPGRAYHFVRNDSRNGRLMEMGSPSDKRGRRV